MKRLLAFLGARLRDQRGAAAVELALILPFIAAIAVVSAGVWDVGMRKQSLHGALKVAAQYYMNGGQDDAAARAIALAAWQTKPSNANVTASRICRCGSTANACNTLCSNSTPPAVFVQLTATATTPGAQYFATQTAQDMVRVR
jgi:Flp pilus assembly protein TadG